MAFLTVSSVTIPINVSRGASETSVEIGSRARAFDGSMRSQIRARKRRWENMQTPPLEFADAETLRAVLVASSPLTATGKLFGDSPTSVHVSDVRYTDYQKLADPTLGLTLFVVIEFTVDEA